MTIEQIVGGVIWIQSMILLAALVFAVFEAAFMLCGQRRCFLTRRRLGVTACASLAVLPLLLPFLVSSPLATAVNATDAIVAQYLKGNLSVSASEMSALISVKTQIVDLVTSGGSTLVMVLVAVFLATLIGRSFYLAINVARIHRSIRAGRVMGQSRRVRVVLSPEIGVPYSTRGLWYYYVVLPENLCRDRDAMQMSIGHEMQHIRQGDVDAEVILSLMSPVAVLNPGFWFLSGVSASWVNLPVTAPIWHAVALTHMAIRPDFSILPAAIGTHTVSPVLLVCRLLDAQFRLLDVVQC